MIEKQTRRCRPANHPADWPEPATVEAVSMFRKGHSGAEISAVLFVKHNLIRTRNAVLGKLNRMGLSQQDQPARPKPSQPAPVAARPKPKADGHGDPPGALGDRFPLARPWITRAFGECAFPLDGPDGEVWSCCDLTGENKRGEVETYCRGHRRVMYQRVVGVARKVPDSRMKF